MNTDGGRVVRGAVLMLLGAATAGMIAVSIRTNFLFGYSLGQSEAKAQVFGWANVSADVWKIFGLVLISNFWRLGQRRFAVLLVPVWLLCVLWGIMGAVGMYAQDRSMLVASHQYAEDARARKKRQVQEIEQKLARITARTVLEISAEIAAVLARPIRNRQQQIIGTIGTTTANCARDNRAAIDACLEVALLKREYAAAQEAAALGENLRDLTKNSFEPSGVQPPASTDITVDFLSWISSRQLQAGDIAFVLPLAFSLLIELISALGPTAIVLFADLTRVGLPPQGVPRRGEPCRALASQSGPRRIAEWMSERTEPSNGAASESVDRLHCDYVDWCGKQRIEASDARGFEGAFDELCMASAIKGRVHKDGTGYVGIRLCGMN